MERFRVEVIAKTPNPQQVIYGAMHQDYCEDFVIDQRDTWPSETKSGEIIVKRLLAGDRGHYGCYTPDTEVLTRRGWVQFPNLLPHEEVVAIDIQTGRAHFESPIAYQKYTINDKIYQVKGQNLSLAVTLDHRMVVAHRKKTGDWTDYYFASAADVVGKPRKYLNSTFLTFDQRCSYPTDLPPGYEPEQLMKLAGFFIGDGCINNASIHTRFRIRKQNKIDYLYALGFEIKEHPEDRYSLTDQKVAAWLQQNFTHNREKYIPWSYLNLTPDLIASLLEGMRVTDGTQKRSSWSYDSTSEQVLDFLQAILHLNGQSGSYSLNNPNQGEEHKNHKPCGRIHISKRRAPRVEICQNNRSRSYVESIESYEGDVFCVTVSTGALLVRKDRKVIVCGNCLEHPSIVFNCGYFPHSVMQQVRTHRIGVSFDVQSNRYTGNRIVDAATGKRDLEEVFYLRPVGSYTDRQGKRYQYTKEQRERDLAWCLEAAKRYQQLIAEGVAEEHARGIIPFDVRQHWVMSLNVRSLMHLLDLRWKKDAQLECQKLCDLIWPHFQEWVPAIAKWYLENRAKKSRLAP